MNKGDFHVRSKIAYRIRQIQGPFTPKSNKYLYFQTLNSNKHGLTNNNSDNIKTKHRTEVSDLEKVSTATIIRIGQRMWCFFEDLHKITHGTSRIRSLNKNLAQERCNAGYQELSQKKSNSLERNLGPSGRRIDHGGGFFVLVLFGRWRHFSGISGSLPEGPG